MHLEETLAQSSQHIQDSPLVQAMTQLIRSQAEQIQCLTEQISKLKETIESLKDEISRLNKTPKRPKFKPNKMEPRDRGKKTIQRSSSENDKTICAPKKQQEEIR